MFGLTDIILVAWSTQPSLVWLVPFGMRWPGVLPQILLLLLNEKSLIRSV